MMTLQQFWADQGCLIWQPYYSQVGAGTMNPATALRVLGPEPWNVGYVEPSIRPDDGRYGDNPNRLQQHYQFQVILKPDPGNPQELYLGSLEALGIDPRQHDIRFVEDNWESPALGAWGLGWEVWLDGQEITQFTYFQQAGGMTLDPVSVEITYGLERIAIALQRISGFREIRWSDHLTYGDVNLMAEREHSTYYFETADVERLQEMYDAYEEEAGAALDRNLVLPAYDYFLKCSHTFNILDSRGAIGVTERQAFFKRMRTLARRVSEAYLSQRESLGFPWLAEAPVPAASASGAADSELQSAGTHLETAEFVLEIGTEELPAGDLDQALAQLRERAPGLLDELRLAHRGFRVMGTPRRLVLQVESLAVRQPDREQVLRGPPAARAYDSDGRPTRAAQGFADSKGVAVEDLQVVEHNGGRYIAAAVHESGQPALSVLAETLPGAIGELRFAKSMRWNHTNVAFSRPVRWLLALHGDQVVPFEFAGLHSARQTRNLRFRKPEQLEVSDPQVYLAAMQAAGIVLDADERRQIIRTQIETLAAQVGGTVRPDPDLLGEVTNLIEAPTALLGSFSEEHLLLPGEVLVSVMKKHQRYFPVEKDGQLLPHFIAVRNGDDQFLEVVREGNEHVIGARFADANFFVSNDLKQPLADYLPRLATLTFQAELGSMLDKTRRIEDLVVALSPKVGLSAAEEAIALRAASLCKADLVTDMVVEMTSLQGIMGRYYALKSGEPRAVAEAIREHYLPRFAGDEAPSSRAGLVIGLADRLDSLSGLFAAGLAPSGNKDPFALRRAAMGIVQNLIAWELDFDLRSAIRSAARRQPLEAAPAVQAEVLDFIAGRLRSHLLDEGARYDVLDAVLAVQAHDPARAAAAVQELATWTARPEWADILPAYSRCVRITRQTPPRNGKMSVDERRLVEEAERELYQALQQAESQVSVGADQGQRIDPVLAAFLPMIPAINRFFDLVLVMDEDEALRQNRLVMLRRIAALAEGVADLSRLEGF